MGKLIIEGNKVFSVDEACMKRKKLTLAQIRKMEAGHYAKEGEHKRREEQ